MPALTQVTLNFVFDTGVSLKKEENKMACQIVRKTDIVDTANRGGLVYPTDTTFTISCLSYIFFNQMKENSLNSLLSSRIQHREVFIKSVVDILSTDPAFACICENIHMVLSNLLLCTFNCFATNLKRQLTADSNEHKDTATTDRTVE